MATKGQTHAKRARELALQEKRERKRAKKAEAAVQRAAGNAPATSSSSPGTEGQGGSSDAEWIR
jgi:hypothetical protein